MSFASDLKDELCKEVPEEESALHALLYGFLLFSYKFRADEISFSVLHEPTARLFAEALMTHCGVPAKITFKERVRGTLYRKSFRTAQGYGRFLSCSGRTAPAHKPREHRKRGRCSLFSSRSIPCLRQLDQPGERLSLRI